MSKSENLVDIVETRDEWSEEATICAKFHDGEYLNENKRYSSPILKCHGYEWKIQVVRKSPNCVHIYLVNNNGIDVRVQYDTIIGHFKNHRDTFEQNITSNGTGEKHEFRHTNYNLLDTSGDLTVRITIKLHKSLKEAFTWILPKRNFASEMLQKFESGEDANVVFDINGTSLSANTQILIEHSNIFHKILEDSKRSDDQVILLQGVEPEHFQLLLRFLYTDELPNDFSDIDHRTILQVANRFGFIRLKLLVEAAMVKTKVNADNAIDTLMFADANCCALLREEALDVFRTNPNAVMASSGWTAVEKSNELLRELMKVLASQNGKRQASTNSLEHTRVAKLRKMLHEKALDVDGTREMLVARLKEANDNP